MSTSGSSPLVVLDTNFLMLPDQAGIDIFSELDALIGGAYRLVVPMGVIEELEGIKHASRGRDGRAASVALALIERRDVDVVASTGDVDGFIVAFAAEHGALVATNDRDLKRRLRKQGTRVVSRRAMHSLSID